MSEIIESEYSNDNKIGISMGGYTDSNDRTMDRTELNRRIRAIQKENQKLRDTLESGLECVWPSDYRQWIEKAKQVLGDK